MKQQFDRMINHELMRFLKKNQEFLGGPNLTLVDKSDSTKSLVKVLVSRGVFSLYICFLNFIQELVEERGGKLFVGVDEYDATANGVLFSQMEDRYGDIAELFNTHFFAIMKQATYTVINKYWVTGVVPVFREGTSPLTAVTIISDKPRYNGLCGFTDAEVRAIAQSYLSAYQSRELETALNTIKKWYNGYTFFRGEHEAEAGSLHNPQLLFNQLRSLADKEEQVAPLEEIGAPHMAFVLATLPDTGEVSFLDAYIRVISSGIMTEVTHQFGATEVRQLGKDASTTWNLLYFFGVLTHAPDGLRLRAPNSTMLNVVRTIVASMPINSDVVSDRQAFLTFPEKAASAGNPKLPGLQRPFARGGPAPCHALGTFLRRSSCSCCQRLQRSRFANGPHCFLVQPRRQKPPGAVLAGQSSRSTRQRSLCVPRSIPSLFTGPLHPVQKHFA